MDDNNFNLDEKISKLNQVYEKKLFESDKKIEELKIHLSKVNDDFIVEKLKNEKFGSLLKTQPVIEEKTYSIEENLNTLKNKLFNFITDVKKTSDRFYNILLENLFVPGIVGPQCKLKNLREYIEVYISFLSFITEKCKRHRILQGQSRHST